MRKNLENPEDKLIWEIANNSISYIDFRSKYYDGESSRYRIAYNKLYDYGLVTENSQMMKLSKTGSEVYLYSDFKKHISNSKMGRESTEKTGNNMGKYIPHIAVIILILSILITMTLSL